jgi:hypothetical protein
VSPAKQKEAVMTAQAAARVFVGKPTKPLRGGGERPPSFFLSGKEPNREEVERIGRERYESA